MSAESDEILQVLREIRIGQQEHIALYRQVAQQSLDAQQAAIAVARRSARLYRIVVSVAAVLVVGLIITLVQLIN